MSDLKIYQIDNIANTGIKIPEMFNYNHFGFQKKKNYGDLAVGTEKGLLLNTEYYQSKDGDNYQNILVKEEYSYIKQGILFIGLTTTIKWYNLDNNIGCEKTFTKMFNPKEIIDFGLNRRNYLLSTAKIYCIESIPNDIYDYLVYLNNELLIYEQGYTSPLISKIQASVNPVKPYITQQIADQLVYILNNVQ